MQTTDVVEEPLTYHLDLSEIRRELSMSAKPVQNVGDMERLASMVGGGALTAVGLSRRTPLGIGIALLGGMLMHRGSSGRCMVYDKLGINTR
ncbi:MAG: YgaP family membrane protein [Candidatus Sumerlaeaceae bacterium]